MRRFVLFAVLGFAGCRPLESLPPGWDGDVWGVPPDVQFVDTDGGGTADTSASDGAVDAHDAAAPVEVDAVSCTASQCSVASDEGCAFRCDPAAAAAWACLASTCGAQLDTCGQNASCLVVLNGAFLCALGCDSPTCRLSCAQNAPLPMSLPGCGWSQCW